MQTTLTKKLFHEIVGMGNYTVPKFKRVGQPSHLSRDGGMYKVSMKARSVDSKEFFEVVWWQGGYDSLYKEEWAEWKLNRLNPETLEVVETMTGNKFK
jgi:hypothetical protein